jgi:uncharacterized protein YqeY
VGAGDNFALQLLSGYRPQHLSDAEISPGVDAAVAEATPAVIKDRGTVMEILKPRLAGTADMGKVSNLVKSKLSG